MFVAFDAGWNVIEVSVVLSLEVLLQRLRNDDGSVGKISRRTLGAPKQRSCRYSPFLSLPIEAVDLNNGPDSLQSRHKRKYGWTQCVKMQYINVGTRHQWNIERNVCVIVSRCFVLTEGNFRIRIPL